MEESKCRVFRDDDAELKRVAGWQLSPKARAQYDTNARAKPHLSAVHRLYISPCLGHLHHQFAIMSSDLPRDTDLGANADMNGTSHDAASTAPATATATAPLSKDVENVMYSDVRLSRVHQ